MDLDTEEAVPEQRKLLKTVVEFGGYLRANGAWMPNYGERRRNGEVISSAFVESAVNQVVSKRMVKAADALVTAGCPLAASDSHPSPQRRPGGRVPPLVPRLHPGIPCLELAA